MPIKHSLAHQQRTRGSTHSCDFRYMVVLTECSPRKLGDPSHRETETEADSILPNVKYADILFWDCNGSELLNMLMCQYVWPLCYVLVLVTVIRCRMYSMLFVRTSVGVISWL